MKKHASSLGVAVGFAGLSTTLTACLYHPPVVPVTSVSDSSSTNQPSSDQAVASQAHGGAYQGGTYGYPVAPIRIPWKATRLGYNHIMIGSDPVTGRLVTHSVLPPYHPDSKGMAPQVAPPWPLLPFWSTSPPKPVEDDGDASENQPSPSGVSTKEDHSSSLLPSLSGPGVDLKQAEISALPPPLDMQHGKRNDSPLSEIGSPELFNSDSVGSLVDKSGQPVALFNRFTVHVGSFLRYDNANDALEQISKAGFAGFKKVVRVNGINYLRVTAGLFESREEATKAKAKMHFLKQRTVIRYPVGKVIPFPS